MYYLGICPKLFNLLNVKFQSLFTLFSQCMSSRIQRHAPSACLTQSLMLKTKSIFLELEGFQRSQGLEKKKKKSKTPHFEINNRGYMLNQ